MRFKGKIQNWNDARGFGFVEPLEGGERAFVHISAFENRNQRPVDGELVTYATRRDTRDRLQAIAIKYPRARQTEQTIPNLKPGYWMLLSAFAVVLMTLLVLGRIPVLLVLVYPLLSAISFLVYAFDKSAAMNDRWRTEENTLHLLSVFGGWPGALIGQQMFRHKTAKRSFRIVFYGCILVNCLVLGWLATDNGGALAKGVLRLF